MCKNHHILLLEKQVTKAYFLFSSEDLPDVLICLSANLELKIPGFGHQLCENMENISNFVSP